MTRPHYFPVSLDLRGRRCVVLGAGAEADRKAARVRAFAERAVVRERGLRVADAAGADVVYLAVRDVALATVLHARSRRDGSLVCCVDDPAHSNFIMPAVARRGRLQIAISTGGASPLVARRFREDIERLLDARVSRFLDRMARLRERVRGRPAADRRRAFDEAARGFRLTGRVAVPRAKRR